MNADSTEARTTSSAGARTSSAGTSLQSHKPASASTVSDGLAKEAPPDLDAIRTYLDETLENPPRVLAINWIVLAAAISLATLIAALLL